MFSYWIQHNERYAPRLYQGYTKREAIKLHRIKFNIVGKRVNLKCVKATNNHIPIKL